MALAIAAYFWLHGVAASEATAAALAGMLGGAVGPGQVRTLASVGQYLLPLVLLLAAAVWAYRRHARRALHAQGAAGPGEGELNAMSGQQFVTRVGQGFRRKGYSVREAVAGESDGGVDLVLKKDGAAFLVQCRQWRAPRVGVNSVRELHGAMAAQGAVGGFVVTSGAFTDEAAAFARDKHIVLMGGKTLRALIADVKAPVKYFRDPLSILTMGAPYCPECQFRMVKRKVKHGENAGKEYWRCARYPDCKGTRPV
ncbi:MAG: restriction endonuclease [Pseudomonadota bacterium]